MHGEVSVVGWKAANEVAKHLIDAGYEVLITSDGERIHELEYNGERHLAYTVRFAHPEHEGSYFELVDEYEDLKTWKEMKEELKVTGEYPADIAEGWVDLDSKTLKPIKKKGKK